MEPCLPQLLAICVASLVGAQVGQQESLLSNKIMAQLKVDKVRGHSNAIYGPVPKGDQIFDVEFLEVAPTPIIADRPFFAYLRGSMPGPDAQAKTKNVGQYGDSLTNATLAVSGSVVYPDGSRDDSTVVTLPLRTMRLSDDAHLLIRDSHGAQVEYMPHNGRSDILLDFQIPTLFLESGTWTFHVDARLGDEAKTCLFAMSVTQWLDGCLDPH